MQRGRSPQFMISSSSSAVVAGSIVTCFSAGDRWLATCSNSEMTAYTAQVNLFDKYGDTDTLVRNPLLGNLLTGKLTNIPLPAGVTDATHPPLTLQSDSNSMDDLWIAIAWGK
jgi:hypothetical protein